MMKDAKLPAIDLHCDTLMKVPKNGDLSQAKGHVTLEGLKQGGVALQCFANFVPTGFIPKFYRDKGSRQWFDHTYKRYQAMMERHKEDLLPILCRDDLDRAQAEGKIGVLLTIEDGGVIGDRLENLRDVYQKGVRLITLTWNHPNHIGYPNSKDPQLMAKGLTPFGCQVVEEMERLGMVVDVSHVSDGVFYQVAKMATKPFLASHSNARAVCPHTRNMTDEMIRLLAEKGGVMGLNLGPEFVGAVPKQTRMEDLVAQVLHIRKVGGSGVLALGSDFDGISGQLDVAGPQDWPKLADALQKAGLTDDELEQMWSKNALRVLREVLH